MLAGKALGLTDALLVSGVGILVVMAELALLAVLVYLLSRIIRTLTNKGEEDGAQSVAEIGGNGVVKKAASSPSASEQSRVELYGVDEATAAAVMASLSHGIGKPLEHLDFKSIKLLDQPLQLIGVDEPTAAVVMATLSYQTGIPLEKLDFKSIRALEWNGIDEPTAAVIMALVSHRTGIPPERLDFKSIKLIEE